MERLRDLDESGLLARIFPLYADALPRPWGSVPVGPGDDAAVVGAPAGTVVATTDSMVRVRDWRDEWSSGHDVGVKVAAQNVADVAAMGAEPTGLLVSLVADPETAVAWAEDLARGIASVAREAGAPVVGGDLSSGPPGVVVVTVTALGDLRGRAPVLRSGAQVGDVVAVCGSLGRSGGGLALLLAGHVPEAGAGLVRHHLAPRPPWESGPIAADAGATALVDVSDGLVTDVGRVARASAVGVDLDGAVLRRALRRGGADGSARVGGGTAAGARRGRGALARRLLPGGHRPRGARRRAVGRHRPGPRGTGRGRGRGHRGRRRARRPRVGPLLPPPGVGSGDAGPGSGRAAGVGSGCGRRVVLPGWRRSCAAGSAAGRGPRRSPPPGTGNDPHEGTTRAGTTPPGTGNDCARERPDRDDPRSPRTRGTGGLHEGGRPFRVRQALSA